MIVVGTISSHPDNFILNCNAVLMEFWYLISLFVSKMRKEKKGKDTGKWGKKKEEEYSHFCVS